MNTNHLPIVHTIMRLRCQRIAPLLVPYADDRLRRAERVRVEAHLENCPACRAEVQTIAGVSALLRDDSMVPSPVADLSPNLWAGIEAEIRRSGVPLDRSAESPLLRPRRRVGLVWDTSWPSSVPVAAAVFSAIVFGTVVLNQHALTNPVTTPIASTTSKSDDTVTIAMRPSASVPALADAFAAPAAVRSSAAYTSLARAEVPAPAVHPLSRAVSVDRRITTRAAHGTLIAVAVRPTVARSTVASKPIVTLALVAPLPSAPTAAPSASQTLGVALADNAAESVSDRAVTPRLGLAASSPDVETAQSAEISGSNDSAVSPKTRGNAIATAAAAIDNAMPASASKPTDDDATVRSGAPADQPMADFAAMSRRQRNLFSYTSR